MTLFTSDYYAHLLRAVVLAAGGEVRIEQSHLTEKAAAGLRFVIDHETQTGALTLRAEKDPDHDDGHSGAAGAQP